MDLALSRPYPFVRGVSSAPDDNTQVLQASIVIDVRKYVPALPPVLTWLEKRMDRERVNVDSIRALEEQIGEHERTLIKLKRARNSLLNISKLPPEVIGDVFRRNITLEDDFDGLDEGSHNFLLVCHHWFEVARSTPEVWSFWGNIPKDRARWYRYSGTAPLDLVLNHIAISRPLHDALQDCATQDTVRRVHLATPDSKLLCSIIASLTANRGEPRSNGIRSFLLLNTSDTPVDLSNLFAHYHCNTSTSAAAQSHRRTA